MSYVRLRDRYAPVSEGEKVEVLVLLVIPAYEYESRGERVSEPPQVVALIADSSGEIEQVELYLLRRVRE